MSHRNARLTLHGRRILIKRVLGGRPVAHVAKGNGRLPDVRTSVAQPVPRSRLGRPRGPQFPLQRCSS